MPIPKKLIRDKISAQLEITKTQYVYDHKELNKLYDLKVQEETSEIKFAEHSDIKEFADLIQVAYDWALVNGFTKNQVNEAIIDKANTNGTFSNIVLLDLDIERQSNHLYFE